MREKQYFANETGTELLDSLNARVEEYYRYLESSGRLRRMRLAYTNYYGNDGLHSSLEIQQGGEQGELNVVKVNEYRNLLQHLLVMTTSQRPALDCRAVNTDAKSMQQTIIGNGIVEYYLKEKKVEVDLKSMCEIALVLEEGFLAMSWNTDMGEEVAVDPDSGRAIKDGDIQFDLLTPLDVIRNPYIENSNPQWQILRLQTNKWDLCAKYPEKAEKIQALAQKPDNTQLYWVQSTNKMNEDMVDLFLFYHEKTSAVPKGRAVLFVQDVLLYDMPLPYKSVPVVRMTPSDQIKSPFGYSVGMDLLALQQLTDALHSVCASNQIRFGVQSVKGPKGADIDVQQIGMGMTYFELDPKYVDLLQPLQLTSTPAEVFNYNDSIAQKMETLSGVNSVARGNPEASLKSGAALALVQSMAVQFNNGLQQSYVQALEQTGTKIIQFLQSFAKSPRLAAIAGKNNIDKMKSFTSEDILSISRVTCEIANPMSRTLAGRMEIANNLLQNGQIKRPEQYFALLETGRFEPLLDNEMNELLGIQQTKEAILEGQSVPALVTDNHPLYILELKGMLATAEAKANPQLVKAVLDRITQHLNFMRTADPQLLQLCGVTPLPPPPMAPPPPGPGPSGGANPQMANPQPPVQQQAADVNMPNMPVSPLEQ